MYKFKWCNIFCFYLYVKFIINNILINYKELYFTANELFKDILKITNPNSINNYLFSGIILPIFYIIKNFDVITQIIHNHIL